MAHKDERRIVLIYDPEGVARGVLASTQQRCSTLDVVILRSRQLRFRSVYLIGRIPLQHEYHKPHRAAVPGRGIPQLRRPSRDKP